MCDEEIDIRRRKLEIESFEGKKDNEKDEK